MSANAETPTAASENADERIWTLDFLIPVVLIGAALWLMDLLFPGWPRWIVTVAAAVVTVAVVAYALIKRRAARQRATSHHGGLAQPK